MRDDDARAVLEAVDALDAAFARRDVAEVLERFVADDDVTFFGPGRSAQASGRAELEERLSEPGTL